MNVSPDPERRAAVRTIWLTAAALVALVVGAVVVFVVRQTSSGDGGAVQVVGVDSNEVAIGPPLGSDVTAYLTARQSALRELAGEGQERVAVVSFVSYRSDADAAAVIDETSGHTGIDVLARLVAIPGDAPAVVDGDLEKWTSERRATLQSDRDEIAQLIPTVGADVQFKAFYEREVARLDRAIAATGTQTDIVFGFVVRGPIAALQVLADRAPIRLVDVGPVAPLHLADGYRGLLPDDTTTVSDPQLRPLP